MIDEAFTTNHALMIDKSGSMIGRSSIAMSKSPIGPQGKPDRW
jgi:hypothetical protein